MKRDLNLCRHILLAVEAHETPFDAPLAFEGVTEQQLAYQVEKLIEAGQLHGDVNDKDEQLRFRAHRLTNAGHDFLELARDPSAWDRRSPIYEAFKESCVCRTMVLTSGPLISDALIFKMVCRPRGLDFHCLSFAPAQDGGHLGWLMAAEST